METQIFKNIYNLHDLEDGVEVEVLERTKLKPGFEFVPNVYIRFDDTKMWVHEDELTSKRLLNLELL